jgi:hypothetical protein
MCRHEEKQCPRCRLSFECKPGNITQCQCFGVLFSEAEKAFIEQDYSDCLCRNCLIELKNEFAREQLPLQKTD